MDCSHTDRTVTLFLTSRTFNEGRPSTAGKHQIIPHFNPFYQESHRDRKHEAAAPLFPQPFKEFCPSTHFMFTGFPFARQHTSKITDSILEPVHRRSIKISISQRAGLQ